MADVFISYSRRDQEFVRRLHEALGARGRDVWVDWEDIPPTAEWKAEVRRSIESSDSFVFVISPESVASRICAEEVEIADGGNKRLIPVVRRDVPEPDIPERLAAYNWIFLRDGDDFDKSLEALISALETDLDWVHAHTRLLVRATEWEQRGRDKSFLLRGRDLDEAERAIAAAGDKEPRPTQLQTEYVYASRGSASKRQRVTIGAVSVAFVVAAGLAAFALVQRDQAVTQKNRAQHEALVAKSGELAAESAATAPSEPELGLLLAQAAGRLEPTVQAAEALRKALLRSSVSAVLRGHTDAVYRATYSSDGREVATASWDGTARLWDARTGAQIATLAVQSKPLYDVEFSPDGMLVTTAADGVRVWDSRDGSPISTLEGVSTQLSVEFSPEGKLVATSAGVFDAHTGRRLVAFRGSPTEFALARFSPDGRLVATTTGYYVPGAGHILTDGVEKHVRIFDAATGRLVESLPEPEGPVEARFSSDGRRIATTDQRGNVHIWNIHRGRVGKVIATFRTRGEQLNAQWSRNGSLLATSGTDGMAHVWDVDTRTVVATMRGHGGPVFSATFSPNDRLLVTSSVDHTARVWDAASGKQVFVLRGDTNWIFDARFSPDGKSVLTASWDGTARVWDVDSPANGLTLKAAAGAFYGVVFSPNGRLVATASGGEISTIRVWDALTGRIVRVLCCHLGPQVLAFSRDSRLLAAVAGRMELGLHVWDVDTGSLVAEEHSANGFADVTFARRANVLTAGVDGSAILWDVRTRHALRTFRPSGRGRNARGAPFGSGGYALQSARFSSDGRTVLTNDVSGMLALFRSGDGALLTTKKAGLKGDSGGRAAFSPDGSWVVVTGNEVAQLRDARTLKLLTVLRHPAPGKKFQYRREVQAVFRPDGKVLATAAGETVRLWSVPAGRRLAVVTGHTDYVSSIAFSPNGRFLVSVSWDGTARVWDARNGGAVDILRSASGQLNGVAFSPDGRLLATAGEEGIARVYPQEAFLPYRDLQALAARQVVRQFTAAERRRYLGSFSSAAQ
jgi:WD40 repeat protein